MPIINNTYDDAGGEMVYTLTAAEDGEEFNLAVTPTGKNRNQLTFWQGDRFDENNFLVAQGDPVRLEYESDREQFYAIVENVFGSEDLAWVREALTLIARVHSKRVEEALEKFKKERADDTEIRALQGHEPTIYHTPAGYRMEVTPGGVHLIPLSNFTGRILEDVIVDDGSGEVDRFFGVEAELHGRRHRFEISSQAFDGLAWVPRHLGALANVEGPRVRYLVAKAFRLESRGLREVHASAHTGWLDSGGRWVYIHAGGAITGAGAPPFEGRVVLRGKLARRKFPSPADPEELKAAVFGTFDLWDLAADEITVPLMLSTYRAALGEVDYSLHLAGPTGLGKTTLAHLAVSHFGAGMGSRDQTNFESTAFSIEREAFQLKDQVLLVDDYLGTPEHRKILAFIGRVAANRSGRGRLGRDAALQSGRPPRGLVITTGEDDPVGQSLTARMLLVRVPEGGGLNLSRGAPINAAQAAAHEGRHALAMGGFIGWLAPRYGELSSSLEARRNRLGHEVRDLVAHSRTPGIYGDLMIALEEWMGFAREIGAVDESKAAALEQRAKVAVMAAIQAQPADADPVTRYRDLLREASATGKAHIRTPGAEPGSGVQLGWTLRDGTYVYPEVALALAKQMAESVGDPLVITSQMLNKRLSERGWLASANINPERGIPVRKTVEGTTVAFLHFKPEFLAEG